MKRILPLCIIVLVCAAAILLAANVLVGVRSDAKQTEPQADTNVNATPAQAGAPADSISEETELFASLSSAAVEQAYKTADGYKELYLKLFSGSGLNLTQDEIAPLAARLGELGCCALALNCSIDMTNPALLNDFFAAVDEGRDADIAIYELCPDAGFLCHTPRRQILSHADAARVAAWQLRTSGRDAHGDIFGDLCSHRALRRGCPPVL